MKRDCLDVIVGVSMTRKISGVSTSVKFVLPNRFCTLKQLLYAVSRLRSLMKMIYRRRLLIGIQNISLIQIVQKR